VIPLISPKPFSEFTAAEYHAYVRSLYQAPPEKKAPAEVAVRLNDKGNPVVTVRRDPKTISHTEAEQIAAELGWTLQDTWLMLRKKKITITVPRKESRRGRHSRA